MASTAMKIETEGTLTSDAQRELTAGIVDRITKIDIARVAYELWQERGCPIGSPEEDWLQAERQLRSKAGTTLE